MPECGRSDALESRRPRSSRFDGDGEISCPRPRRVGLPASPSVEASMGRRRRSSCKGDVEVGREIMSILFSKNGCTDVSLTTYTSPPVVSPPVRAGNPLVKDSRFNQQALPTIFSMSTDIPKTPCKVSASVSPLFRIEGFAPMTMKPISDRVSSSRVM